MFFSAYVPLGKNPLLPTVSPPLLREHRLYQADWLLRYYGFRADELLDDKNPNFSTLVDPKCEWALRHPELFPVEINTAQYQMILRIPGIGVRSALKIAKARHYTRLSFEDLKKMRISMKRARYFITVNGKTYNNLRLKGEYTAAALLAAEGNAQISFFDEPSREEKIRCLIGEI